MKLKEKKIGVALTGSFCTFEKIWPQLTNIKKEGASVRTIFSDHAQLVDSRFGNPKDFLKKAEELTGEPPITTIAQAEPIGPKGMFDIVLVAPCTGNTLAKLAAGITDTPVLMAVKSHLRNNRPVVLSLSSNDLLSMNMKNIGFLMNVKNIYFVPFGQDDYIKKPNSMTAHTDYIVKTLEEALEGRQIQPVINSPFL